MVNMFNEDYRECFKNTSDKYYDIGVVDPPYFSEYGKEIYPGTKISTTGIKRHRFESNHWDVPNKEYVNELIRVTKNQIIWGINYFDFGFLGSGRIIWDKNNDKSTFSKCEIAYCSFHNRTEIFRYTWNGMIQGNMKNKEKRIHPTQKPVSLYKWILKNYANQGDKIVDTHGGSGSICIACYDMGFDLDWYEKDKAHFSNAYKRFEEHTSIMQMDFKA